jgi:uncharacterized protein
MDQDQREEIVRLTIEYGGEWGINHTRRLLHLVELIGDGLQYDSEVVWLATHLHDWGGYSPWAQPGVDHALRSKQVAETYLREKGYPQTLIASTLECIELHHQAGSDRSIESILLRDADALDFLGVVGILRDFAKQPKDLRKAYETTRRRMDQLLKTICLERAQLMAVERMQEMKNVLASFEKETFGCF